ncbi:MAG TPA: DUF2442 domain-containing protein [Ruminiclostridium sp.]
MDRVVEVLAMEEYRLLLTFSNGEIRIFDVKPYLNDKFWAPLSKVEEFQQVKVAGGSVEWPLGMDFCPDEIYQKSMPIGRRLSASGF